MGFFFDYPAKHYPVATHDHSSQLLIAPVCMRILSESKENSSCKRGVRVLKLVGVGGCLCKMKLKFNCAVLCVPTNQSHNLGAAPY